MTITRANHAWVDALESGAPDVVAAWRGIEAGQLISVRREVRRRAGPGTAAGLTTQLAATAGALTAIVEALPEEALRAPGGEADWNVAQCVGHTSESRMGLCLAASYAAADRWPAEAPSVVQGIPGAPDQDRETLIRKIAQSQRIVERATRAVVGHESDPCPLDHPQVGRLRCGEWVLFAGVHDLMHLDQLHELLDRLARGDG